MKELVLVKSFRPDRFVQACQKLVNVVLGNGFNADKELDLAKIVESEVNANTPVLMCSVAGFDASGRVDDLSAELGKPMTSIAIGKKTHCAIFFRESDNYKIQFSYIFAFVKVIITKYNFHIFWQDLKKDLLKLKKPSIRQLRMEDGYY